MKCKCGSHWVIVCHACHEYTQTWAWNNIETKIPTEAGSYLVTDGESVQIMDYYGEYKGSHDWSSRICCTLDVKYWMELPKPPKED